MKRMLVFTLMAVLAGSVAAQPADGTENTLGLFFSTTEFEDANTNLNPAPFTTFPLYLVLLNPVTDIITGLEFQSRGFPAAGYSVLSSVWKTSVNGTAPMIPVGDAFGGQVVWAPASTGGCLLTGEATVLCTYTIGWFIGDPPVYAGLELGPYAIPSIAGFPVIAEFDPNILHACELPIHPDMIGADGFGVVATLYGDGVVATENHSLSNVKALFQ